MTNYTVGILIIGSLFWDNENREPWRQERLDMEGKIPVRTPIRYGRKSDSRQCTYTMVFSNDLPTERYGWALVVPCRNPVTNADELVNEAKALWAAERSEPRTDRLSANWGAVGLLTNPDRSELDEIKKIKAGWIQHIRNNENRDHYTSVCRKKAGVNSDGILTIPWPCTESGAPVDMDFLLATATKPTLNDDGSYVSPKTVAQAWNEAPDERYFYNNRCAGITTADDDTIMQCLCEL